MADKIEEFKEQYPSLDSYWRSIILFGQNTASYKFALGKALFDIVNTGTTHVSLEDLAIPYSKHICEHLKNAPRQATNPTSTFLKACKDFNEDKITETELIDTTVDKGFNYVLDAFHTVNKKPITVEFFKKDFSNGHKEIYLTTEIFKLVELPQAKNLEAEIESRWNLVETAWNMNVSKNILNVKYDNESELLFIDDKLKRKDVTSARGALNGYQKGKCFYCFDNIIVNDDGTNTCDVDHFFPHSLQPFFPDINLDGVWNLVLSCYRCNRGENGKFALVPAMKYLERLHRRNEYLIYSHHPLRETIIKQTGATEEERRKFLLSVDQRAIDILIHRWEIEEVASATF